MSYHNKPFRLVSQYFNVRSKKVLEIGGNSDMKAAMPFLENEAALVVISGLGHIKEGTETVFKNLEFVKANGHEIVSKFGKSSFDIIFGVSIIEHISDPSHFLEQVYYCLRPGGFAIMSGNPIWTSKLGHHVWVKTEHAKYFFSEKNDSTNPIPDWGHLLYDQEEMKSHLLKSSPLLPLNDINLIVDFIYKKKI